MTPDEKQSDILQTRARGAAAAPSPTALGLLMSRACLTAGEMEGMPPGQRQELMERLDAQLSAMRQVHEELKTAADRRLRPRLSDLVRWPAWPMLSRSRSCRGQ